VNSVADGLGDGENFVEFRLHKFDRQLHAAEAVFASKIERPLRVLEIVSFEVIGRPIPQAPQVKLRSHVLKQNFHAADSVEFVLPSTVMLLGSANRIERSICTEVCQAKPISARTRPTMLPVHTGLIR